MTLAADEFRDRVIVVVRAIWGSNYKAAERDTSVPSAKWKRLCNRMQQPTNEMIVSLGNFCPYFLVWMMTGGLSVCTQLSVNKTVDDALKDEAQKERPSKSG